MDLPFSSEYAKTGRAKCKLCKEFIDKDSLRMAAMVQSAFHDGKQANWFHSECFFKKQKPNSTGDILNFEKLRYEDQKFIEEQLEKMGGDVLPPKGKKRSKKDQATNQAALKDYGIEYSKSGRAGCCGCSQKIAKDDIRIKKVVYDTEVGMKYGGQPLWHHVDCFVAVRDELGYWASGTELNGFSSLTKEDQAKVKKSIPAAKASDVPALKKMKPEPKDEVDKANDDADEKLYKRQNETFHKYKEEIKNSLRQNDIIQILNKNKQHIPEGVSEKIEMLADVMSFGALEKCSKCPNGLFVFGKQGYICTGNLTEWTKCENLVREPLRSAVKFPAALKKNCEFLKKFKGVLEHRAIKFAPITNLANRYVKKEEGEGPRVQREKPPLYNLEFFIDKTKGKKDDVQKIILKLGGKIAKKLHDKVAAVISTEEEVEKMSKRMETAEDFGIQVVSEDYLTSVTTGGAIDAISTKAICDWGTDPHLRCSHEEQKSSSRSLYSKSGPSKVTMKLKGGVAVDPDSHLQDEAHIFERDKIKYNSTLTLTDIQRGKNSFYKLQVLQSDVGHKYWLFRGWGRIGTNIGDCRTDEYFGDVEGAIEQFKFHYQDKSGNIWNREFKKIPGKMVPADIDYGEDDSVKKMSENSNIESKLKKPVQDIIKLIFDVENMKKVMMEFELDTEKMPLGKLSKKQLEAALKVLGELSNLIAQGGSNSQFIDATNRFFTFVPHSFGTKMPPILDSIDLIKTKVEMLENLMEIELAYSMLNSGESDKVNPIDTHYDQLKTEMDTIDHNSDEFKLLVKYVQNTHAATHNTYDLEIVDAFKISRSGEERRYKPFKKLNNRKLLWHGSRVTNYAGILSHGLKIAPPEAPVTGYMFGKGIYFADMVSKSANYCCTSKSSNTGLVLLCEVALGEMEEYTNAHYVTKLQKNKHSCKGVGKTSPDPSEKIIQADGLEIPLGKSLTDDKLKSSLLYNEYIVYDVAQVKCQYLLRLNFKYKY